MKEIEFYLEVDKDALTEERAEEYRQQYDEGWEKEGYLISGDLKLEEIYVDTIGSPTITIRAYNDEIYLSLHIPLNAFLFKLLERNDFQRIIRVLEKQKADVEKIIENLERLDSAAKSRIIQLLVSDEGGGEIGD
ncbi:hypothetical protein [Archaeoglobus sp.]